MDGSGDRGTRAAVDNRLTRSMNADSDSSGGRFSSRQAAS
jgi:hypothetical protein